MQRQVVNLAREFDLTAHNRDRGGAQHEMGDVEIDEKYYGCKRRKLVPVMVAIPAELLFFMMNMIKKSI